MSPIAVPELYTSWRRTLPFTNRVALCQLLADLYQQQMTGPTPENYLVGHARPSCVANQVRTFQWYYSHLPSEGAVLDWGCKHAPDSCLLRATTGDRFALHGCDFFERDSYSAFHHYAGLDYTRLTEVAELPYSSECFEVVIASGVLEHVAMDYESLKELYRILKPDGLLVITYLPNRWSLAEWHREQVLGRDYHRRRYGLRETRQLLLHTGFAPITWTYQTFIYERLLGAVGLSHWEKPLNATLRTLLPIHVFSAVLSLCARKVKVM